MSNNKLQPLKQYVTKYGPEILDYSGMLGIPKLNEMAKEALEKGKRVVLPKQHDLVE